MSALSTVVLLVLAQAVTPNQRNAPSSAVLQVGVFSYGPDGKSQAAAYDTTLAAESFQYIAGCAIGGGNRPVPANATDAWRVSGKVESLTADEAVVRVDWQRTRAAGVAVTSPGGSIQLTLHPGDRVPLDTANPDPSVGCGGRTIGFEARFGPRPGFMVGPGGALSESPAVTIMRGLGGGGTAGAGTASVSTNPHGGGGSVDTAKTGAVTKPFTADLWLVKTDRAHPDGEFNMQGLVVNVQGTTEFAFSPFAIETSAGPANIQVSGVLRSVNEEGAVQLVCILARTIRYSTNDATRNANASVTGTSTTRNPMPGPDEVLSFELPPVTVPNTTATVPEQYSVRLRIRSRADDVQ
jgi:hypothetical protein